MHTTRELLRAVMKKHQLSTPYKLAQFLGMSQSNVTRYMQGKVFLGHDTALRVAELLDMAPDYVIACTEAERAPTDATRRYWRDLAQRAGSIAAALLVAVFAGSALDLQPIDLINQINGIASAGFLPLCIMLNVALAVALLGSAPKK